LGIRSKTSRKEWFDEECRLATQENNKAGQKVTECNTRSHAKEYKRKCTEAFKLIRNKK
jgi:hypothetical protein